MVEDGIEWIRAPVDEDLLANMDVGRKWNLWHQIPSIDYPVKHRNAVVEG